MKNVAIKIIIAASFICSIDVCGNQIPDSDSLAAARRLRNQAIARGIMQRAISDEPSSKTNGITDAASESAGQTHNGKSNVVAKKAVTETAESVHETSWLKRLLSWLEKGESHFGSGRIKVLIGGLILILSGVIAFFQL